MTTVSPEPFGTRLEQLRRAERLTFRALAARLKEFAAPGERPVSHSHLVALASGRCRPTPEVIKLVSRAFDGVEPESFAEWQLWQVQRLFDPDRADGLEAALAELQAFKESRLPGAPRFDEPPARRESRRHVRSAA